MKKELMKYLDANAGSLTMKEIIISFVAAIIIGLVIYASYRFAHAAAAYSKKFNVSLVMLTLVTTLVMTVIGDNVALSLGMVGALSIVRFRTAIKDSRDTAYIFWCVAAGICCGVQDFMVAGIGSGIIFLAMLVLGNTNNNDRYLIIIRGSKEMSEGASKIISEKYLNKAMFRVENVNEESAELIYEISSAVLNKQKQLPFSEVRKQLFNVNGVKSVNLICQNDEINR